ncbi:cyclic nucleotide-binding domain-containing protein [Aestuariispira insulae]|uniref:Cyclic nucleotide-binding domain-containing protein n=1 Tax=Aestuariispira insulae TaxID=1461337 RepID=A0A3D9HPB4_9PROT|nr:cyclic nucleotide-binding domain-containing protein [Aestuariispira insulae]RED51327.1 hypothetical protein DFP90_103127 [Aestuariispira insulae]
MTLQKEVDLLRNIPLFSKVEPSKLKLIAFTSERMTYEPGQVLFREGDPGDAAYIIIKGSACVSVESPDGPQEVNLLGANEIVGEIALLCDIPRTATVTAREELSALIISKDLFYRLIEEFPAIGLELLRELAHKLENTTARLRDCMGETTAEL